MLGRVLQSRASWTLVDQAVVSVGTFGANIVLARHLPPSDYGVFAMAWGGLLLLQIFNTGLVSYPLTIQSAAPDADRGHVVACSITFLAVLLLPLSVVIAAASLAFDQPGLIVPLLILFWVWQLQELLRRVLFAELRHRDSVPGDFVFYIGQVVAILLLIEADILSVTTALLAMAAAALGGAAVQYFQVRYRWQRPRDFGAAVRRHWTIGRWALASNFITSLRVSILIWLIAAAASSTVAAEFKAVLNIVNFANPILFGLCNLIPAAVAHASRNGVEAAWREARQFGALGTLPTIAYYGFVVMWPETVLQAFYGAGSIYVGGQLSLRILGVAFMLNFVTELICSFMHGMNSARIAFTINALGTVIVVALAIPMIAGFGWLGAYWALLLANAVRLMAALGFLKQVISNGQARAV